MDDSTHVRDAFFFGTDIHATGTTIYLSKFGSGLHLDRPEIGTTLATSTATRHVDI
jgi:hypothetical protein